MTLKNTFEQNPQYFGKEITPVVDAMAKRLPPGGRIFDVGAGQGRNALALAQRGFIVDAIDQVETGMRQMREQADALGLKTVHEHVGKIEDLMLPDETYDGFCFINVLHFSSPEARREILQRAQRATKKNGYHSITIWSEVPSELMREMGPQLATEEELRELYADWLIEGCKPINGTTKMTDASGASYPTKTIVFLAKKVT